MDNASVIKDIYAAFNRGDVGGIVKEMYASGRGEISPVLSPSSNQKLDMKHFIASGDAVAVFSRAP